MNNFCIFLKNVPLCVLKKDITWVCSLYSKNGKTTCDSPNTRESELDDFFKI